MADRKAAPPTKAAPSIARPKTNNAKPSIAPKAPAKIAEDKKNDIKIPLQAVTAQNKNSQRNRHTHCVDRREHTLEIADLIKKNTSYPKPKNAYEQTIAANTDYIVRFLKELADQEIN